MALKVLSFAPGLSTNARSVGAILLERYNRRTGRCDPGIGGMAKQLQVCDRTVIRSIRQLERVDLFRRHRHGGNSNRNKYEVNWTRFKELEAAWSARLHRRRADPKMSLLPRQECHLKDDAAVTQTCIDNNLHKKTCLKSQPKVEIDRVGATPPKRLVVTPRSRDASEVEAERRWTTALHECFASKPVTYGEIIEAITPDIQMAATKAELQRRSAGIAYILRRLRLGEEFLRAQHQSRTDQTVPGSSRPAGPGSGEVS